MPAIMQFIEISSGRKLLRTFWRWAVYAADGVVPMVYLDLAVLTVALAAFQGWLGGELVYTDGVFVRQGEMTTGEGEAVSTPKGHGHHH